MVRPVGVVVLVDRLRSRPSRLLRLEKRGDMCVKVSRGKVSVSSWVM